MLSALYYPHTQIRDEKLLKSSLLLWDQVEYITPSPNWKHERFSDKIFNEAIDIITQPHMPTNDEKESVHKRVKSIVKNGIPDWFLLNSLSSKTFGPSYPIYPQKLSDETWYLLESNRMAEFDEGDSDFHVNPMLGLMIMSLLADACAGNTKRKITDRSDAYSWLIKYATAELGGEYTVGLDASQVAPTFERLVTISVKVLDTDDIPLKNLVSMRKREASESGHDFREFRLKYLEKVENYVAEITKEAKNKSDVKELERQFEKSLENDVKNLRKELNLNQNKLVFSKEVGVAALAIGGALLAPVAAPVAILTLLKTVGVGALVKTGIEYKAGRRKAFKENAMSWLYLSQGKIHWK